MKILVLYFLLVFLLISDCIAQKLEMKFFPASLTNSISIFSCNGDSCGIQFNIYDHDDSSKIIWSESKRIPSDIFKEFELFMKDVENLCDKNVFGFDGITIKGKYFDTTGIKQFKFWSPLKRTRKYELFKMTIGTLRKYMESKNSKAYLRRLKSYLD
jgi:hypothetical protein